MGLSPCGYSYLATHLWKTSLYTEPGRGQQLFLVILISLRPKICTKTAWKKYYYYPENTKPYNRGTRKRFKCTFLREQHHQKFWNFFIAFFGEYLQICFGDETFYFLKNFSNPQNRFVDFTQGSYLNGKPDFRSFGWVVFTGRYTIAIFIITVLYIV